MNAHAHKDFAGLIPQQGDPRVGPNYEIELLEPLGNISAGDALIFDVEREPAAGEIVGLRRAGARGVEIGTLLTDLPKGRWELLRTFGNVDKSEDGTFMFRAMADDIVRFPKVSEFVGIDSCIDARIWPKYENASAPKAAKPTPARGPDGRFLKTGPAEASPEPARTAKPWQKTDHGEDLPTEPETVPNAQYSRCWQQLDKLSQIAFKMKMAWGLLGPKIADELGRSTGPLNGLLKDGGDGLYVMATEDVEIIEYHLVELGNLIEEMHAADAA